MIEHLAASEAVLRERVRSLEQDVEAYRALAQEAIHRLHELTRERGRQREQLARLHDELRFLRATITRQAVAA